MKSKHTPGPWIAPKEQVNLVCTSVDWNDPQVGSIRNGMQITVSLNQGEEQAAANAQLIAAAPEMLATLEHLAKIISRTGDAKITIGTWEIGMIEYAIKLARGEK